MTMKLSLEEVVRQHFGGDAKTRPQELDANLRRLKAEHLKTRGDEAIQQGNYRQAWERYSEAIELEPGKAALPALHSNRCLAYMKAQRHSDALKDAQAAAQLAPGWSKAHWRCGAALLALERAPEASLSFLQAWRLAEGDAKKDCEGRLRHAVQRMTREQLGRGILALMDGLQGEGRMEAPQVEEASDQELGEGMFRQLKEEHQGQPRPGPYYARYLDWLKNGLDPAEAYILRAAAHIQARCYLQARADAQAAVKVLRAVQQQQKKQKQPEQPEQKQQASSAKGSAPVAQGPSDVVLKAQLALAYNKLGIACMAEPDHADRDCRQAAKAFLQAAEEDPSLEGVGDRLQDASEDLSSKELDEIQLEIYHEGTTGASSRRGLGTAGRLLPGQRLFQATLRLAFPTARAADCGSGAREALRCGLAAAAGVSPLAVSIERVLAPTAARRRLEVHVHVQMGPDVLAADKLVKAIRGSAPTAAAAAAVEPEGCASPKSSSSCSVASKDDDDEADEEDCECDGSNGVVFKEAAAAKEQVAAALEERRQQLAALLGGSQLSSMLGLPDPALCSGEIEDVTPACAGVSEAERAQQEAINRGGAEVAPEQERRLVVPSRPKMELELPYRMYRLVRSDGSLVERVDKHPFCMSRCYYNPKEKPEEVWAELADGSCRWRQTGSEVKVVVLSVPADLPARHLAVDIQPYFLKVWNRDSGEVYLEGSLERGVVPEDCFWTHCGGEGEDGCAIYLRKMNLEVLQKHWVHSEMWWPRLLREHGMIAWDDYEKDYSDLPEEVLDKHRIREAIQEPNKLLEESERKKRDVLQEAEDLRKRTRQERLGELRSGKKLSWVELDRGLPAASRA